MRISNIHILTKFQSTRPRKARQAGTLCSRKNGEFQSTRPRKARLGAVGDVINISGGFNPRARVRRDVG